MSSQTAMTLMSVAEFGLWAALGLLFWTGGLHRRFPAMGAYIALRLVSMPALVFLFFGQAQHWFNNHCFVIYFFVYWAVYIASAAILFFVCTEVFRSALAAFSGLMNFGLVVFRWAAFASLLVSFSTLSFSHRGILIIPDIAFGLMRSVSILELCLLGFLCLSMNALRLPARDMGFGIALGFGLMSANDFIQSLLISTRSSLTAPWQFVYESMILVAVGTWITYSALPEPVRKPVVMPANSTIYRWNEIASALGHTGTQVAVQQPASGFFLTDVESVVERVLARNLKDRESES
jgi:hypothetical protein